MNQRNAIPANGIKFIASVIVWEFVRSHKPGSCGSVGTDNRSSTKAAANSNENNKSAIAAALGVRKRKVESPAVAIFYCAFMDCESAIRLFGCTRMMPPRGLSMSAISKTEMDTIIGTTSNKSAPLRRSL